MKKLLLLLLIALGAAASRPDLRQRAAEATAPLMRAVHPLVMGVINPVRRRQTQGEEQVIANFLVQAHASGQSLPPPNRLRQWLDDRTVSNRKGLDPWQTPYTFRVRPGGITVVSAGPDRARGTEDDVAYTASW